jgi:superfamily II DNA helicase RecQ
MQDQVARLHEQGFAESVDYVNSDRPRFELAEVLQGVLDHRIVLLYVAPERLRNAAFLDVLCRRMEADEGLEYVVFDEAHCVNQWGYEFRPDYFHAFTLLMRSLRGTDCNKVTPFLLLSATLTASDRRSIRNLLAGGAPEHLRLPLAVSPDADASSNPVRAHIDVDPLLVRGNILDSQDFETALAERLPHIQQAIQQARENRRATGQRSAVIIFVTRRAHADDLAKRLTETAGCEVESYHAGLDSATRDDIYTPVPRRGPRYLGRNQSLWHGNGYS